MPQPAPSPATSNLKAELQAEREAMVRLREVRDRVAMTVARLADSGMSYDRLACLTIRARTGHAPTLRERKREADRLRQIAHRQRVTGSHDIDSSEFEVTPSIQASSDGKELPMERLIKRRTIEETFTTDAVDERRTASDEHDDDNLDADHDDDVEQPPRRRAR